MVRLHDECFAVAVKRVHILTENSKPLEQELYTYTSYINNKYI